MHIKTIENYLIRTFACPADILHSEGTFFTVHPSARAPHIQMLAYRNCTIVCTSKNLAPATRKALEGRSRDEIFEFPYVYGQTIHYIPDGRPIPMLPMPPGFTFELLRGRELPPVNAALFPNSLPDASGLAMIARCEGEIVAIAGASLTCSGLYEAGADVLSAHRGKGLAPWLMANLTRELLQRGVTPFYSASVTNIASQRTAQRSGYVPCWVDTYGTTLAPDYPFQ